MRPVCKRPKPPRGWQPLVATISELAALGTSSLPGRFWVRDVARRCCNEPSGPRHLVLYKRTMSDDEIRALIAELLLGGRE